MNLFMFKPWVTYRLLPFIGGLLYPLGFPIKGLPHFMGLTFIGLFLFLQSLALPYGDDGSKANSTVEHQGLNLKTAVISLLLFSLGYCLLGYYWIPYTLKEFGAIPFPINTLLGTLFSLIIAPQYLAFILILHFWARLNLKKSSVAGGVLTRNLIFSFLLMLLENLIPQQFPAHLGHTWLQLSPYLGLTPIFGVPLFSFVSYFFILSFVAKWHGYKFSFAGTVLLFVTIVLNLLMPLNYDQSQPDLSLNLRLVQANIGNFMKLDSETGGVNSMQKIYKRYYDLSTDDSSVFDEPIDLIVWPETAYPQLLNTSMMRVSSAFIPSVVRRAVSDSGAQLFFGGYDKSGSENKNYFETEYNAGFLISRDGKLAEVYHKMLLIPFGESLPFGPLNPIFSGLIKNLAFFAKGQRYSVFELDGGQRFISAICYEILFSGFIRSYLNKSKKQPHFIINLTNDSWYGDTSEPYQHQYLAFWRALEFQIPIVRMTNTGITSVLYPDGHESKRLTIFQKANLDLSLPLKERDKTIFQRFGLLGISGIFLLCLLLSWLWERFHRES